jgi:M6 family metalloprotease-like protein
MRARRVRTRGRIVAPALVALGAALAPSGAGVVAQDIETVSALSGRPLPAGYHELIARDPGFFKLRGGWIERSKRIARDGIEPGATLPILVVNVLFADSPPPPFPVEEVRRALFDGPSDYGTVADYYLEVSGGRVGLDGEVTAWVRSSLTLAEVVGRSYGIGADARMGEFLVEALTAIDSLVDWGRFDNDGPDGIPNSGDDDGQVDVVAFQFAAVSAPCGGPGIWPHRARIRSWLPTVFQTSGRRPDGSPIVVNDYIIQSAVDCDGENPQTPATIAHELGHVFGLPDLYDASGGIEPQHRRWVIGCWSLMSAGSWGCGDGDAPINALRPSHMGPWEKGRLGWLTEEVVVAGVMDAEYVLEPVRRSGRILRVPLSETEYLLIEYRDQASFDRDLPAGGVLIYHIDLARDIRPCATCEKIYRVALVEADGNGALLRTALEGGNRGEAGDAFASDGPRSYSLVTTPALRPNAGPASPVMLHMAVEDGVARVRISTDRIPTDQLLAPLLRGETGGLTAEQLEFLDKLGNGNGRFDVGDLRAYLGVLGG